MDISRVLVGSTELIAPQLLIKRMFSGRIIGKLRYMVSNSLPITESGNILTEPPKL